MGSVAFARLGVSATPIVRGRGDRKAAAAFLFAWFHKLSKLVGTCLFAGSVYSVNCSKNFPL